MDNLKPFLDVFVPLFAVMNPIPVLPLILGMTEAMSRDARQTLLRQALLTAVVVGAVASVAGSLVLKGLSVEIPDLRIAGGLILLVFAVYDLLFSRAKRKGAGGDLEDDEYQTSEGDTPGIVPLGIPILVGPATLTALIVFSESHGPGIVLAAFAANSVLSAVVLSRTQMINNVVGAPILRAGGKVMGVFLAAVAVSMIRVGLQESYQLAP